MLLVQLISGNYWSIENVFYENANQYTPAANQKTIQNHNWVFKQNGESEIKDNLVWDDLDKQVILYPDHLKLSIYKEKTLAECRDKLKGNLGVLYKQVLKDISKKIADADTIQKVNDAKAEIDSRIDDEIKDLGFYNK